MDSVKGSDFSKGFFFGTASSAYQIEGAAFKDGKGPSIWDTYTHRHPERIVDQSNGDIAIDSYHRYKEDVALMKQVGFNAYRFSIAWSRVLPKGKRDGGVNMKGIEYYNNLINELLANGIQPFITLFHWDVPQALEDEYQGFMDRQIINDFGDYAELCFEEFGDRVKYWITFNEPYIFTTKGYVKREFAPCRCSSFSFNCLGENCGTEPYIVAHNQILAHAAAVIIYKTKYQGHQKGVIGITLDLDWYVPYSDSEADKQATSRAVDFCLGWFLHPLTYGDYPPSMRSVVQERLPKFTKEETILIKESFDFLGMNYYTANYAKDNPHVAASKPNFFTDLCATLTTERNGVSIGPKVNKSSWIAVYPPGLKDMLVYIKDNYENPVIYITENGYADYDSSRTHELIEDKGRIKYYHDHLYYLHESIKAGVRVKGYFVWSLLDNFEWACGYTQRFGLTYIDYKNHLKRIPKDSAKWFHNFLTT